MSPHTNINLSTTGHKVLLIKNTSTHPTLQLSIHSDYQFLTSSDLLNFDFKNVRYS